MSSKNPKVKQPSEAVEKPAEAPEPKACAHARAYICAVGSKGQLVKRCPDCGKREEAAKDATPGPRPMPLGHLGRCEAQCAKLDRKIARQKELIAAAGPQSDEAKGLKKQLAGFVWQLGHAEKRSANAKTRAAAK